MLKSPDKIYVSESKISGRGVFAKEDIKAGEILEECHFIELNEKDFNNIDPVLKDYVFTFPIGNNNSCVVFDLHRYIIIHYFLMLIGNVMKVTDYSDTLQSSQSKKVMRYL